MTIMTSAQPVTEHYVEHLAIDLLRRSPMNTRRRVDPAALDELAESIRMHGIITPLLVRPRADGSYEIAAGERRFRAAKLAGLAAVPAIVRSMEDVAFLEVVTIENLQREDVHPLDEALGYRRLMQDAGYTADMVAEKVGKSTSYVYQRLKLAELNAPLQEVFREGRMSASHAVMLARLQPKDQARAVTDALFEGRFHGSGKIPKDADAVSVRDLARWIHNEVLLDLHAAPWKKDDPTLLPKAGPCTTCPKRVGNQPQLFPDVQKGDTCTDPACFALKLAAFIERKTAEIAEKDGQPPLRLSSEWRVEEKGLYARDAWAEAVPGSCEFARAGILVEADNSDRRRRGQVLTVCIEQKCRKHHSPHGAPLERTPRQKTPAERRRDLEDKIKATARRRTLDAILDKVEEPLSLPVMRLIAERFVADIWFDFRKQILERHGLTAPKRRGMAGRDYDAALRTFIDAADEDEVTRFLVETALIKDAVNGPSRWADVRYELPRIAKLFKVNPAVIERAARKELSAAAQAAAARAKQRSRKSAPRARRKVQTSAKVAR